MTGNNFPAAPASDMRLFAGEKALVVTGLIGFAFAAVCALYILLFGAEVLPEGNVEKAFSFNAAIGAYGLSFAAILPLSGLSAGKRAAVRRFLVPAMLYSYGIETVQHMRGINPRFSDVGTIADMIASGIFGLISLMLVVFGVLIAIPFFRRRGPQERPLMTLGIRWSFVSVLLANAAGLWMILLQGRYTGDAGNLIVIHGLGFHALQTLPLLGWLAERASSDPIRARTLIHGGSVAWTAAVLLVGAQTALGRSVFELTALPIAAAVLLLGWLAAAVALLVSAANGRASYGGGLKSVFFAKKEHSGF